jgi:hypothetical protein
MDTVTACGGLLHNRSFQFVQSRCVACLNVVGVPNLAFRINKTIVIVSLDCFVTGDFVGSN